MITIRSPRAEHLVLGYLQSRLFGGVAVHPASLEATVYLRWRNPGVLRSRLTAIASAAGDGEGRLELGRVTPERRCHRLLPVGLHSYWPVNPSAIEEA
jgi:hypothetical protein